MQSKAKTVAEYLKQLPPDRRAAIETVRQVILANVDGDIEEGMQYGAIGYYVPHRIFANGYHCDPSQPLPYIGLASQKQCMALYLHCSYMGGDGESFIRKAYAKAGRKLDMGKSCLRFKSLDALDLEVVAEVVRGEPTRKFIERYLSILGPRASASKVVKKVVKKTVKKVVKKTAKKTVKKAAPKK